MGVINTVSSGIISAYNAFLATLPPWAQQFLGLFFLTILVFIYAVVIWKFYRFIAKKNIIGLNLNKYNTAEHPLLAKTLAGIFYIIEYIIILPFLIFIWYGVFTFFLFVLSEGRETSQILLISAIIISAIRMTTYYSEDLSKDLAKMLPFTLLAVFILDASSFNLETIMGHIVGLPGFVGNILIYFLFIIVLETILRIFDFLLTLFGLQDISNLEDEDQDEVNGK